MSDLGTTSMSRHHRGRVWLEGRSGVGGGGSGGWRGTCCVVLAALLAGCVHEVDEPTAADPSKPPPADQALSKRLLPASSTHIDIPEEGSERLTVTGTPGKDILFTIFDGGIFEESGRRTATVQTDERGSATVTYRATEGIVGDVRIVARREGSPERVQFLISLKPDNN